LQVGTYDPQEAFMVYHRTAAFQQEVQQLQAAATAEPQRAAEIQQQAQAMQNDLIQRFQQDVTETLPDIASEKGVSLVAVQVVYSDPSVEVRDLTSELVGKLNENQPNAPQGAAPAMPGLGE